eukprot:13938258-Ditylum_brightwellii.AAC.1
MNVAAGKEPSLLAPKAGSDGQKKATPDTLYEDKLLKIIEYLHKKLGKYVAIHQRDALTDRDKEFLAGKDCEKLVVSTRMKLTAAC